MLGRLFDSPMTILIIAIVIILLFGAPKLPMMARSLGQSMRILKSEVGDLKTNKSSGAEQSGGSHDAHEEAPNMTVTEPSQPYQAGSSTTHQPSVREV